MKFTVSILALCLTATGSLAEANLRLELGGEQPSGIFLDRETLQTQTAPLLWLKVVNAAAAPHEAQLKWQVADAAGFVRAHGESQTTIPANGQALLRQLFPATARGAFLFSGEIVGGARASWPFAVVCAPTDQFRPLSFFTLDAPLMLADGELDFYQRLGARVLRSPLLSEAPRAAFETQLKARVRRNIATLGVLDDGSSGLAWNSRALAALKENASVKTFEMPPGQTGAAEFFTTAHAARADATLLYPLGGNVPRGTAATVTLLPGGYAVAGDASPAVNLPAGIVHPAALRRALASARDSARQHGAALHVRHNPEPSPSPWAAAGGLVSRYVLAILSGASGAAAPLESADHARFAQAAAFAAMTKLLEDAAPADELFPNAPAVCGVLFKVPTGSVALLWATRPGEIGRLRAALPGAKVLDIFGNELPSAEGELTVPLGAAPVYVTSDKSPAQAAAALRSGRIEGLTGLAARALPITQKVAAGGAVKLAVRLQNLLPQPVSGTLRLTPPAGWSLAQSDQPFALAGGEIRTLSFATTAGEPTSDGFYALRVTAETSAARFNWSQSLRVVIARNVAAGKSLKIDGDLTEWRNAAWMDIRPQRANGTAAKVALMWDGSNLYAAAQVSEANLKPSRDANEFWQGDALQLAFGTRGFGKPTAAPFRDTDCAFALLPSLGGQAVALLPGQPPLAKGARCSVRRDEKHNQTSYEVCLPLAALPGLNPADGRAVRFGWILHNDDGPPLEWGAAVSVFQWWRNTASFVPASKLFLPAQMPIGFVQEGAVSTLAPVLALPSITPAPPGIAPGGLLPPMSPRTLPPVKEPIGKIIPPILPAVSLTALDK